MSYDSDEAVAIDPELEMEEREDDNEDDEEELSPAMKQVRELQNEFVQNVQKVIEPLASANPEHRVSIEAAAEGILGLIEGNGADDGYILTKRDDANFAMVPCTRAVYEEHLRDFVDPTGLDLSRGLLAVFDDINN